MTIDGKGEACGDRDPVGRPSEHPWTETERRRKRPGRGALALMLAWLWPSSLGPDELSPSDGGAPAARRRWRMTSALMLFGTALAAPSYIENQTDLTGGRLNLFHGGTAAGAGQSASHSDGRGGGSGASGAARAHGNAVTLHGDGGQAGRPGIVGDQADQNDDPGGGQNSAAGESESAGSTLADDGGRPGVAFLDAALTGSGGAGGFAFGGAGGLGDGGLGGSGGGGGSPGGQPPGTGPTDPGSPDGPTDHPTADPRDPPGEGNPNRPGSTDPGPPKNDPPTVDGRPTGGDGPHVEPNGPTSAAPEPQAWLLMILGFGAVGHALRRRKAVTA